MKKSLIRTINLVLLAGMLAGTLVGCGSKDESKSTSTNTKEATGFHSTGLPIMDKQVTLKVMTTRWGSMGDSFTKNKWIKDLETKTNVKIEWQVQSLNDWATQKSVLIASGDLPDVILGNQTFNDADIIGNQGLFLPVDDLVKKYMPNYSDALNSLPELKKVETFPD